MNPVDYDRVAPAYDRRYQRNPYDGVRACLHGFVGSARETSVAEVGCGTGHWLADLSQHGFRILAGLDRSIGMLEQARAAARTACLVHGMAERLPWVDGCFDRVFCVNALHHFTEPEAFVSACHRVLRPGGGLLTIGLDPHANRDEWWVYDFFPAALRADRVRYLPTPAIRDRLAAAGFRECETSVAQHIRTEMPFDRAANEGFLDRRATSQFMVIDDADFEAGMGRLRAERPMLRSDLRLYGTTAWRQAGSGGPR